MIEEYMKNDIPIEKKMYLWQKKNLIKSLVQEPPISKDCLRNSHFLI